MAHRIPPKDFEAKLDSLDPDKLVAEQIESLGKRGLKIPTFNKLPFSSEHIFVLIAASTILTLARLIPIKYGLTAIAVAACFIFFNRFISNWTSKRRRSFLKEEVFEPLIRRFFPNLAYLPEGQFSGTDAQLSGLLQTHDRRFLAEDFLCGDINGVDVNMAEIHDTAITEESYLLLSATLPKKFTGEVSLFPRLKINDFHVRKSTEMLKARKFGCLELEDEDFNQQFITFTRNEMDCRYLLTLSLQRRISDLAKKLEGNLSVSFRANRIFLLVPTPENLFEPNIHNPHCGAELKKVLMQIHYFGYLVNSLRLDLYPPADSEKPSSQPVPQKA